MRSPKLVGATTSRDANPKRRLDADTNAVRVATELLEETKPMPNKARRTLTPLILACFAAIGAVTSAKADLPPDYHGRITIENVWITPAKSGGESILRLRIVNEGHDHLHLMGVETSVATHARIVGKISDHETTIFDSISVRPDSEVDLTTDHLWIELAPVVRPMKPGESIPLELVFLRGRVHVDAHVHGAGEHSSDASSKARS